jgi:hypothetical protein
VPLEAELVEQRWLVGLALAHHGLGSRCHTTVNQRLRLRPSATAGFSTQSAQIGHTGRFRHCLKADVRRTGGQVAIVPQSDIPQTQVRLLVRCWRVY